MIEDQKIENTLPRGRRISALQGTNIKGLYSAINKIINNAKDELNDAWYSYFASTGSYFLEKQKDELGLPNEILEGSREDIYLMKHLRGNTNWHFQAMANLNDVDISFEYFETDSGAPLPADLAFNLIGNGEFQLKIIFWNQEEGEELPAKIPFLLGTNPTCLKLQKLYNEFKPAPNELIFEFQNGIPPLERIKLDFKK